MTRRDGSVECAMTALAGIWNLSGKPDAAAQCARMLAAQRIYGPHGDAVADLGDLALGRCLFETLPEDQLDRGPVEANGGRFRLVGDVRLDDRAGVATALGIPADQLARMPDAALLVSAWGRWGEEALPRLYGDYAFALWDAEKQVLVLARDPFGGRPLHYHRGQGFLAFASMPKGLHALADVPYAPDEVRAAEFLALMAERGPRSFFAGISRVEPGQVVVADRAGIRLASHWQPPARATRSGSGDDHVEGLREHLDRAVAARLRGAEERVGTHLSAGFDSAAVSATAARLMNASGGDVVAFTGVPRSGFVANGGSQRLADEGELAAATAAMHARMQHVRVPSDGVSPLDELDRDFYLFERPLANAEIQHWWKQINAEAQRRDIRVVLTAQGGNAALSFSGLPYLSALAARGRFVTLAHVARKLVQSGDLRWGGALATAFGPWIPRALWVALIEKRSGVRLDLASYSLVNRDRLAALQEDASTEQHDFDPSYRPRTDATEMQRWMLGRVDFGNNQKGALAGWGVDLRDATTDRRLVEYCMSIPLEAFLLHDKLRGLAKAALADRLPAAVLQEQRKGTQAADWYESFRTQRDHVRDEAARLKHVAAATTALDMDRMSELAGDWPENDWGGAGVEARYRYALLRGLVSGHFLRKASRSNA